MHTGYTYSEYKCPSRLTCAHTCMYVLCMYYVCQQTPTTDVSICMYVCMYVYIYIYSMYICMYARTCIHNSDVCACASLYVCSCMMCVYWVRRPAKSVILCRCLEEVRLGVYACLCIFTYLRGVRVLYVCTFLGEVCAIFGDPHQLFPAAVWLAVETTLQQEPTMHSVFEEWTEHRHDIQK